MEFCPACGVNFRDGVYFASRVVRDEANAIQRDEKGDPVRVYDVAFTPKTQNSRICKYAKREGCINTCKEVDPAQTFEARSTGSTVQDWYVAAKDLMKHD